MPQRSPRGGSAEKRAARGIAINVVNLTSYPRARRPVGTTARRKRRQPRCRQANGPRVWRGCGRRSGEGTREAPRHAAQAATKGASKDAAAPRARSPKRLPCGFPVGRQWMIRWTSRRQRASQSSTPTGCAKWTGTAVTYGRLFTLTARTANGPYVNSIRLAPWARDAPWSTYSLEDRDRVGLVAQPELNRARSASSYDGPS